MQRHTEFFGPDLARGPFSSNSLETSVVQVATALAQLRAPLQHDDDTILAHADFIRQLADRLAPEIATAVRVDVTTGPLGLITTLRVTPPARTLLRAWVADDAGGGETTAGVAATMWLTGHALQEVTPRKHFVIVTDATGVATVQFQPSSGGVFFWGVARGGRVVYSAPLYYT
jgi:hypothetical protein